MISNDVFMDIKETNNIYSINIHGNVKHNRLNRFIKPQVDIHGYCYFSCQTGNSREIKLKQHRLIMIYFGPEQDGIREHVNHIDGNKLNNDLSNLEWCTQSENCLHKHHVLKKLPPSRKGVFGKDNPQSRKVKATNVKDGSVLFFDGASDAERKSNGMFMHQHISKCANGKLNSHKGYKWEYV